MKERVQWIDLLRIVATWGVISIHGKSCYEFSIGTREWVECNVLGYAFTFCVPVFLMLSGYLTLDKRITIKATFTKRILRVLLMKIVSMLLCFVAGAFVAMLENSNIKEGGINALRGWGYGTSYLSILAGCYLVVPLIFEFVKEKKNEEYFLVLSAIFCFVVPTFVDLDYIKDMVPSYVTAVMKWVDFGEVFVPAGALSLFVLGHYLGRIAENITKKQAIIFFLFGFCIWVGSSMWQTANPDIANVISAMRYGRYYGSYVSPFVTLYSASVFVFFKVFFSDLNKKGEKNYFEHLGRNSVMIFLLHGIIINLVRPHIPVFWCRSFIFETIIDVSLYFIIGYLLSLILEHIPILNKIR